MRSLFLLQYICSSFGRILELGYGKEIEEILNRLGSQEDKSVSKESSSVIPKVQRQNLLLSATLNEKVNHLAKISLKNPVLIGIEDRKMSQHVRYSQDKSLESDVDDETNGSLKLSSSVSEEFKLPTQLVQRYIKGIKGKLYHFS